MRKSKSRLPLLIMGLGNPGASYAGTRHNVGYRVADRLLQEPPSRFRRRLFSSCLYCEVPRENDSRQLIHIRYAGYMNNSGVILPREMRRYGIDAGQLLVVVDNMDLPPGTCRLKKGGGTAGHNGLKSVTARLGRSDFMRLYIGVGRPSGGDGVVEHVLGEPDDAEDALIEEACLRAAQAVSSLAHRPFDRVVEELNRRGS